jgi:hypothetical protein
MWAEQAAMQPQECLGLREEFLDHVPSPRPFIGTGKGCQNKVSG